jgi:spore germination protein KB
MNKEVIPSRQGIAIMVMFIIGTTLVLGSGSSAKQDIWLAVLLAIIITLPAILVYSRLLLLFPGKDLFDILKILLGGFVGKVIALFFVWDAFFLGALVIRNFAEFAKTAAMPETPQYVTTIFLGLLCIWAVKEGIEVIGRWNSFVLPILLFVIAITLILSIPGISFQNIRPVLYNGISPVLSGAFSIFAFPFAETVIFTMVFYAGKRFNVLKVYISSLLIGGTIILFIFTRNYLVLGLEMYSTLYFPTYAAVSLISIGDFLQRIESTVAIVLMLAGFSKIGVCLYASVKGVAKILNLNDYRPLVVPIGLMMMNLSCFVYSSIMEMTYWAENIYRYYEIPFQIIIPIILLIIAEIKVRVKKSK